MALATLCRLMPPDLPQTIDPVRLARAGATLKGTMEISHMERLGPLLNPPYGTVEFELDFSKDDEGCSLVHGGAFARVSMTCQRCFEPVSIDLQPRTNLMVVTSEEAARDVPEDFEPLLFCGENLLLAEVIEDELLLALPLAPLHNNEQCHAADSHSDSPEREDENGNNPFAVLKNLEL